MTIGVSELQKNISMIRNLKETLYVVDKKTNELLATILPNHDKHSLEDDWVERLGGSMANDVVIDDLDQAIKKAYHEEMMKKYGNIHEA
jgi:hypothetical protein